MSLHATAAPHAAPVPAASRARRRTRQPLVRALYTLELLGRAKHARLGVTCPRKASTTCWSWNSCGVPCQPLRGQFACCAATRSLGKAVSVSSLEAESGVPWQAAQASAAARASCRCRSSTSARCCRTTASWRRRPPWATPRSVRRRAAAMPCRRRTCRSWCTRWLTQPPRFHTLSSLMNCARQYMCLLQTPRSARLPCSAAQCGRRTSQFAGAPSGPFQLHAGRLVPCCKALLMPKGKQALMAGPLPTCGTHP